MRHVALDIEEELRNVCQITLDWGWRGRLLMWLQVKGENNEVNVKRLPKKPTPPRFGRKLTAAQRERATHICVDCGYIYCDP